MTPKKPTLRETLAKGREFLGDYVVSLIWKAILVGVVLFGIETFFIFVAGGFLRTIGVLDESKAALPSWYPRSVGVSLSIFLGFGVLRGLALSLKTYLSGLTYQSFNRTQREKLLDFGLNHADEVSSHEIVGVYMDRVSESGGVLNGISQLALTITSSLLLFAMGIRLAPLEMILGITLLGLCLIPLSLLNRRIQTYAIGLTDELDAANRILLQGLRHHFFLKIYGLIPKEIARGQASLRKSESYFIRFQIIHSIKGIVPQVIGIAVICAITYVSLFYLHTPGLRLLGFFYIFIRLAQSAAEMNGIISDIRIRIPGFKRLYEWHTRVTRKALSKAAPRPALPSNITRRLISEIAESGIQIEAKDVTFGYPNEKDLFKNLNLSLRKGDTLVVQGESGVGKSTLLTLLLGMASPRSGTVTVNGIPVEDLRDLLCEELAYVGPEPYLIAGSVRENLLYGQATALHSESVTDAEIWAALEKAQLDREIRNLTGGLDEMLLEHTQLSTGQKQRMAIARAILRRPKLLILDEASANLDSTTEGNFIAAIQTVLKELTTIVISHKATFNGIATQRLELKKEST